MAGYRKVRSRKHLFLAVGSGLGALTMGAAFCSFVILPLALRASGQYDVWIGIHSSPWKSAASITFVGKLTLGTGLIFMLLVTLPYLVRMGILNSRRMAGFRRYMIVINLVLAALLTTPEVVTQFLMFVPLQLLYEASIWIARYAEHKAKKPAEN